MSAVARNSDNSWLRVVDASIFPVMPCANTNVPTLRTAERIADAVLGEG
jgi:5-(hydroxymethyl)furfural/furfural oxidase